MKSNRFKLWINLYRKAFVRNREHIGIKTSYNLYWMHPWLRLKSRGRFMHDESEFFPAWMEELKKRDYKKVLLLGNAPSLNELSPELFKKMQAGGYLTIGLNRSIYQFQTDVLIWTDLLTIDDILKKKAVKSDDTTVLHVRLERDHRLSAEVDERFHALHRFWAENKSFIKWPLQKLFMFRNSAVAALHLCQRLGIQDVTMIGFGFDNREYFYKTKKYKKATGYEIISPEKLDKNCGGYDTQRIIREVLEHLIQDEGFQIRYNGTSDFLATISDLQRIDVGELESLLSPLETQPV